ncbi:YARHG domain-containing protein [Litoreibacter ascidiaceicola]|uniref:YARHG domain-containing protein n=1 Tax=Litoreibacter ascidiaceicola TaxID=1486859 RepID=A0A1M5CC39_9RHOB|nr:DUF4453 domain-containing protein [Litoreibacter ascidiaceicola]SHF52323.1 YARHG domain-containing protein [Litoreibacter ascidiaceicola]
MKYLTLLLIALIPLPALADDPCADLWWSRNHLFDQAGYCFASPLGQSAFYNGDCTTSTAPTLSPGATNTVSAIREEEARWGCDVDTNNTYLDLDRIDLRRKLVDVAVNDGLESSCLGYRGADIAVFAGANEQTAQIGRIRAGDTIGLAHYSMFEGWQFVSYGSVDSGSPSPLLGWVNVDFWAQCEAVAG